MQAFYRMHNVKRLPTGPRTPWPNRAEMGVRSFKKFLLALVDTASKKSGRDHSGTDHSCPVDAQSSDGEKHTQVTLAKRLWNLPCEGEQEIS